MTSILARLQSSGTTVSGELFQYRFHLTSVSGVEFTLAQAVACAHAWQNSLKTGASPLVPLYGPATTWNPIQVDMLDPGTGKTTERGYDTVSMAGTGSSVAASLPPSVAVCVTLRSNEAGPRGRGRFYLPAPLASAASSAGRMTSATLTSFSAALANAFTFLDAVSPDIVPAIYSKAHNSIFASTRADVGDVFDSQRPRRDKLVEARSPLYFG
jgi:hypothetical protein